MPPKASNIVEIVKQISLQMVTDKSYTFSEGTSVMKQHADASAKAVGVDSTAVSMGNYERQYPGAKFELDNKRFWFIKKSAIVKFLYESIPVGAETVTTVHGWEKQMPESKKEAEPSSITSKKNK